MAKAMGQRADGKPWTVSMEQEYFAGNSGFLIAHETHEAWEEGGDWAAKTAEDLRELGWEYLAAASASRLRPAGNGTTDGQARTGMVEGIWGLVEGQRRCAVFFNLKALSPATLTLTGGEMLEAWPALPAVGHGLTSLGPWWLD